MQSKNFSNDLNPLAFPGGEQGRPRDQERQHPTQLLPSACVLLSTACVLQEL